MEKIKSLLGHNISKGAAGTLALNICNQLFLFIILALLARTLSPNDFGLYAVILSTMTLLALPFSGGFSVFVMRHVSKYVAEENFSLLKGVVVKGLLWTVFGPALLAIILYCSFPIFINENVEEYKWGLPIIILSSFLIFLGAILRGLKKVVTGRFPEFFLQPALFLFYIFTFMVGLTAADVLKIYAVSFIAPIFFSLFFVLKYLPRLFETSKAQFDNAAWIKSVVPLVFSVGLIVANMNIDVVMVGALAGDEQAGQYRVASRLAAFIPFFLFAVNNAVAPRISAMHTKGELKGLQNMLTVVARITFVLTLPIIGIFLLFGSIILELFFGSSFVVASVCLMLLVLANAFSVLMGQVGQVMSLTGYEKYTAYAVIVAVIVNISLNYILVPQIGINGAAIATGLSIVVWNTLLAFWTIQKTGLYCTVLGPIGKRAAE